MQDLSAAFLEYARLDRKRTDEGLTVAELERWGQLKRALTLHFSPGLDPREVDRRRSVRVTTRLRVEIRAEEGWDASALTRLSRNGAFVQTTAPLPPGSQILLRIEIAGEGTPLEISGVVVTSHDGPTLGDQQPGMGIRFEELSDDAAKRLADLYERTIRSEYADDSDAES